MTRPRRARVRGLGGTGWTPMPSSSSRDDDAEQRWLDHEIDLLHGALREHGELSREALGNAVDRRSWGPGRFSRALREARRRGAIATAGRHRYRPH
jgi:hypothetical protein